MRKTVRKVKTCLPYGMVFTLIFKATNIDLTGEDGKDLQHIDTYSAKSLQQMGYQFFDGSWKKKISRQRINESFTDDDEETDEQLHNIEISTTTDEFTVP